VSTGIFRKSFLKINFPDFKISNCGEKSRKLNQQIENLSQNYMWPLLHEGLGFSLIQVAGSIYGALCSIPYHKNLLK
jgi:hypothetical protein